MPNPLHTTLDRRSLAAGSLLFAAGEAGEAAYLIVSGRLEIFLERPEGDLVLAHLGPGEIVGEMAILDRRPRSASVRVLEDSALVVITERQFVHRIGATDPVLRMFLDVVLARYRETVSILERMQGAAPAPARAPAPRSAPSFDAALGTLILEREIQAGVESGAFALHFQPIVHLGSGRLAGFEALMRWHHPSRGLVGPAAFIPVAESSGLIVDLTRRAFEEVGRTLPRILAAALANPDGIEGPLFVSVNVSGRDLADPAFPVMVAGVLARTGIAPASLKIEVTESMLMLDPARAAAVLAECRRAGVGVAIDDFGTGYSSLSYLGTLPVTTLKIDRAFVSTLLADETSRRIVQAILRLADELAVPVVAEGIEHAAEADALAAMGCAYGQGYLFGRPAPLDAAVAAIRTWAVPTRPAAALRRA